MELDYGVGVILHTLKKLHLDKHTFVFFTSDNGAALVEKTKGVIKLSFKIVGQTILLKKQFYFINVINTPRLINCMEVYNSYFKSIIVKFFVDRWQ